MDSDRPLFHTIFWPIWPASQTTSILVKTITGIETEGPSTSYILPEKGRRHHDNESR